MGWVFRKEAGEEIYKYSSLFFWFFYTKVFWENEK